MSQISSSIPADLKRKTALGVLKSVAGQAASFALRIGSMVIMARLVTPEHFGLVGMVTSFVGILGLFRDAGLSTATVQRETITDALVSTLFWINLAVGFFLAGVVAAASPLIAAFFGDERLTWITIGLSATFVFNGAMAQHRALLQRQMRFGSLALADFVAAAVGVAVGISMAAAGAGYWSLVGLAVAQPFANMIGYWAFARWTPSAPSRQQGVGGMLKFGGVMTLNSVVVYIAYNTDKVLIGRFLGAEALGLYGRAYQLINIPTENLLTTLGWVMFPALSRVQSEPQRLRNYFLKGYGLFLGAVTPVTCACAVLADEIVRVLLGPQWTQAVPIFRLLAPTVLAFALINPMGHLMVACGHSMRSLKLAFFIAPVVIVGYLSGLPYGVTGVAIGFAVAMLLVVPPTAYWAVRGTQISTRDLLGATVPPVLAGVVAASLTYAGGLWLEVTSVLLRLVILSAFLGVVYMVVLLLVFGQWRLYREMLSSLSTGRQSAAAP